MTSADIHGSDRRGSRLLRTANALIQPGLSISSELVTANADIDSVPV
jgi:hypothetical protein